MIYRFAGFELDPERYLLSRAGRSVDLEPRVFEVLRHLVAARGRTVSKDDLVAAVWDGRFVSDAAVARAVQKARRALEEASRRVLESDGRTAPRLIETVHGRGYRMAAAVETVEVSSAPSAPTVTTTEPLPAPESAPGAAPTSASPVRASVAIVGLRHLGDRRESDWIGLALAELIACELTVGAEVRVVPCERVAGLARDLPALAGALAFDHATLQAAGSLLGADLLVTGSYLSAAATDGGRLRANLTLREASSGDERASVVDDGSADDLIALAAVLADRLRTAIDGQARPPRREPRAWSLLPANRVLARRYSEAVALLRRGEPSAALPELEAVALAEPAFALGHAALASSLRELGFERRAAEVAARASRLAGGLPREHRLLIEGLDRECARDFAAAARSYSALASFYPDDIEYGLLAARAQVAAGALDAATAVVTSLRAQAAAWRRDPRLDLAEATIAAARRDAHRMIEHAAAAARKAAAEGARRLEAQAWFDQARGWRFLGNGERTEPCYQRALELYQGAGDRNGVAAVLQHRGATLLHQGHRAEAESLVRRALAEFTDLGRPGAAARCVLNLGMLAQDSGDSTTAVKLFEEALATFRELGDSEFTAQVLQALVNVRYGEGDAAACLELSLEGLALAHATRNRRHEGEFYLRIQDAHFLAGRMAEAADACDLALAAFHDVDYPLGEAMVYNSLGSVRHRQGDLAESARLHLESLERFRRLGDAYRVADASNRAAVARYAQGHLKAALELHRESLAAYEQIGHRFGVGVASYGLAADLLAVGAPGEAEPLYRTALEVYAEIGNRPYLAEALRGLAEVQVARGELDAARHGLDQALEHLRARPAPETERNVRLLYARIELEEGRAVEAERAVRAFLGAGALEFDADSEAAFRDLLAQSLLEQGRTEEARAASRRALALTERGQRTQLRLGVEITAARATGAAGDVAAAAADLLAVAERARAHDLVSRRLEAELALAALGGARGASDRRSGLAAVAHDAETHGLGLLAHKASSGRRRWRRARDGEPA